MSTTHLERLVAEQNRVFTRQQELQQRAEDENRDWTAEERQNWDEANARLDVLEGDIARLEAAGRRDSVDFNSVVRVGAIGESQEPTTEDRAQAAEENYERAFGLFLRGGMDRLDVEQRALLMENRAAQATTPGSAGGYLIPPGYRAVITETLKAYGGLYNHANVIHTSTGNPLQWPSHDGTAEKGRILAENNQVTQTGIAFGTKSIGAYTYSSDLVLVSLQLLQDSVFNLDQYVPERCGERLGRIMADHFITGDGSTQPEGILTNATVGVTAASGGITYDNIVDLEHSVDPAYRELGRTRFLFNDSTLASIRKLKDSMGRPLWLPVPTVGMPATINGLPYTIDQSMPNFGAGNKSIAFGDFQAGYLVRQVLDMQMARLAERYADFLQVGYFAFLRLDAKVDDPRAYRVLTS